MSTGTRARPAPPNPPTRSAPLVVAAATALAVALAGGLGAGVATSYLQGVLPRPADFLANSGAVWTVVAVLLTVVAGQLTTSVATSGTTLVRRAVGVAAGLLALLGEVLGYYAVAAPIRGIATSRAEQVLWVAAALVIGPFAGLAAHHLRCGPALPRAAALGGVGGVIAGEGLYALVRLHDSVQGGTELGVAAIVVLLAGPATAAARRGATRPGPFAALALSLAVAGAVTAVVAVAYSA